MDPQGGNYDELWQEVGSQNALDYEKTYNRATREYVEPLGKHSVPISSEHMHKLQAKLDQINEMALPTVRSIERVDVLNEMKGRLYDCIRLTLDRFEICCDNAIDIHDNKQCCERLLVEMDEKTIPKARKIIGDY